MRIIDVDGKEIINPDLEIGYLKEDKIKHHHKAVKERAEKGHYKVIKEYENGGKDVEWIVDVPKIVGAKAYDEYEPVYRYILYTEEELEQKEKDKLPDYKEVVEELRALKNDESITDIQMALADLYESDDSALTDLQMAVAEIYEMLIGGNKNG